MPHASLKLIPGVDQTKTPALNEAAISESNLIRFMPDRSGLGLVQPIGGWTKYYPSTMAATVRAIWPWRDTNEVDYLGVGTVTIDGTSEAQLAVISDGVLRDITPRTITDNIGVDFSTTAGSEVVQIEDPVTTATDFDSVFIATPVSIGGLVLFGLYQCYGVGPTTYEIHAADTLGNPALATSTVLNAGALPVFDTTSGESFVEVTLADHGFSVGDTFTVLLPTSVGGITLFSNYIVQSVTSSSVFVINAQNEASGTATVTMNDGNVNLVYFVGFGAVPAGTGYGIGGYGSGGYGTGSAIVPTSGIPIYADNWSLDNWGEILIACPHGNEYLAFETVSASGDTTDATITFDNTYVAPIGATVVISGMTPTGYNGIYYVNASSAGSITFTNATTGAMTGAGTIKVYVNGYSAIYQWRPTSGQPIATIIPNSPVVNEGIFVAMPQRQIIAWGSTFNGDQDPLLVRWCDVNNFTAWIGTVANQAGSYRIPRGSRIVGGIQGPQQALLWTDLGVWAMQYVGQPYVYQFNEVGTGCGLIGRRGAVSMNGIVYWMGQSQFFRLAGGGVDPIPCPLWDVIFQDLDRDNLSKITVAANSRFGEVAWYYPTTSSNGEVSNYVKYNVNLNQWDFGTLGRTAWINESVLGPPIGADPNLYLYQHETSTNADGAMLEASFQTGYFAMADADVQVFVDEVWPDMKWGYYGGTQNASVNMTFYVTDFPGATPNEFGPYTLTESLTVFNTRFRGRLVSIKMETAAPDAFWRTGNIRYRIQQDGRY